MAVDKLVDSAQLDAAMTATADAIRAKRELGGDIQWDASTGFSAAINSMDEWAKPSDWPDIESLPINTNLALCLYMLFDCATDVRYAQLVTGTSSVDFSFARWENGVLGPWVSATNTIELPNDCDYIVIKAEASVDTRILFSAGSSGAPFGLYYTTNNAGSNQPCVWMFGQLNPQSGLIMYQNQSGGFSTLMLKRARIRINSNVDFERYGWAMCPSLKSLIIEGVSADRFALNTNFYINAPNADVTIAKCEINKLPLIDACKSLTFADAVASSALNINDYTDAQIQSFTLHGDIKVSQIATLFRYCAIIKNVDISGFDLSDCTQVFRFFLYAYSMTNLSYGRGIKIAIDISHYPMLTHDSLVDFLDKLGTVDTATTVTLGNINKSKLTSEEIAIATEKGWTVA